MHIPIHQRWRCKSWRDLNDPRWSFYSLANFTLSKHRYVDTIVCGWGLISAWNYWLCNDWLNAECHTRDTAVEKLWLDITNMLWNHRKSLQRPTIIFNSIWSIHKKKKRSFKSVRVVLVRYMWIQRSKWKPWAVSRRSNLRESIQVIGCNTIALQSAEVRKCIDWSSGKQLETFLYYQTRRHKPTELCLFS